MGNVGLKNIKGEKLGTIRGKTQGFNIVLKHVEEGSPHDDYGMPSQHPALKQKYSYETDLARGSATK